MLSALPSIDDPRVLIGVPAGDDAGVYRLDDETALVQTVDVFSPSVDDPYTFGQIAAANSLSDVYAMGGQAMTALSVVAFPIRTIPDNVMHDILRGGIDKMAEAGVPVIGGHSINDSEIKAGFAVTGLVNPARVVTNAGARPGDRLVLTKPLGTGIISFAAQIGRATAASVDAVAASMATLNRAASDLMLALGAHACTDVTGFGLMGHLVEMASSGNVEVEVVWDDLPLFDGVLDCLARGIVPGAVERNREACEGRVVAQDGVSPEMMDICFDAQTSGGLLVALPEDKAHRMLEKLRKGGITQAAIIGEVVGEAEGKVSVRTTGQRTLPEARESKEDTKPGAVDIQSEGNRDRAEPADDDACCAEPAPATRSTSSGSSESEERFKAFMKVAGAPGALDVTTKQAINIALSALTKCEPCLKAHVNKARQMGFTEEEIDEAVWMAVSFGGSPVMMFCRSVMQA